VTDRVEQRQSCTIFAIAWFKMQKCDFGPHFAAVRSENLRSRNLDAVLGQTSTDLQPNRGLK